MPQIGQHQLGPQSNVILSRPNKLSDRCPPSAILMILSILDRRTDEHKRWRKYFAMFRTRSGNRCMQCTAPHQNATARIKPGFPSCISRRQRNPSGLSSSCSFCNERLSRHIHHRTIDMFPGWTQIGCPRGNTQQHPFCAIPTCHADTDHRCGS